MPSISGLASQLRAYWLADTDAAIRAGDTVTCDDDVSPPPEPPPDDPPPTPDPDPDSFPGKGNLLYVSSGKGLAKCVMAYGTDGTDGAPVWSLVNDGLDTADKKQIRAFNLDPFSVSGDHFTAAWALTDAGLYRCTGLPDSGTWAVKFTASDADTLLGLSGTTLCYTLAPSVLLSGFIAVLARSAISGGNYFYYFCWSTDSGATWNGDSTKWIRTAASTLSYPNISASTHVAGTYYISSRGQLDADQAGVFAAPLFVYVARSTSLPTFVAAAAGASGLEGNWVIQPYCNNAGVAYSDDSRSYTFNSGNATLVGARAVAKHTALYNPIWFAGGHRNAGTDFGSASFGVGAAGRARGLFIHLLNEDRMVAIISTNPYLFTSTNNGAAWSGGSISLNGQTWQCSNLFMIPANQDIFFMTGKNNGTGKASVGMTINYGTAFTDLDSTSLSTLLGLTGSDGAMDDSFLIVDYFKA